MLVAVLVAGCGSNSGKTDADGNPISEKKMEKKGSSGKTLEVLLVSENSVYTGATKELIDSLFKQPQVGLPGNEPMFDLVHIPTSSFKNTEMFRVHRNVLIFDINAENPNKVYRHADEWAAPQIVFEFMVKDAESLAALLRKYYPSVLEDIYRAEHRRIIKAFNGQSGYDLRADVKRQFGFDLAFSDEFRAANLEQPSPDYAWIRKEAKDFSIGVLVKVVPYTSKSQFEEPALLTQIDSMMRNVGGPADGSYMGTECRMPFYTKQDPTMDQSSYCVETRGCWRLFGDFMGGPFVNYALLSPDNKHIVMLCAYAYSPRFPKRDYLMQVESICHSIRFEEADQNTSAR